MLARHFFPKFYYFIIQNNYYYREASKSCIKLSHIIKILLDTDETNQRLFFHFRNINTAKLTLLQLYNVFVPILVVLFHGLLNYSKKLFVHTELFLKGIPRIKTKISVYNKQRVSYFFVLFYIPSCWIFKFGTYNHISSIISSFRRLCNNSVCEFKFLIMPSFCF